MSNCCFKIYIPFRRVFLCFEMQCGELSIYLWTKFLDLSFFTNSVKNHKQLKIVETKIVDQCIECLKDKDSKNALDNRYDVFIFTGN